MSKEIGSDSNLSSLTITPPPDSGADFTLQVTATASWGIDRVRVRVLPDGRIDRRNAAKYVGRTPKTLAMWQMEGRGPKSVLVGGRRYYYQDVLDAFIRGDAD